VHRENSIKCTQYYTKKELKKIANSLESAITLPVNIEIEADHRVFDLSEVEAILRDSADIFLNDCGCRSIHKNCNKPLDTCLAINVDFDYSEKEEGKNSRRVTIEEAVAVLRRSHDAGLVHMAYIMKGDKKPFLICSCCTCCCHTLGSLLRKGVHTQILTSKLIAIDDGECIDCGRCIDRCIFGARSIENGVKRYNKDGCFGCGLCVSSCPVDAITLIDRV
jgi:Pyruvate/2-oxoacid:ferredoxin oxidoreductase delta subunit